MKVVSTLLPPVDGVAHLVMETFFDGKQLTTAVFMGWLSTNRISDVGQVCLNKLALHADALSRHGAVNNVAITTARNLEALVRQVLISTSDADSILFWCESDALCAKVIALLGLTSPPAVGQPHSI